MPFEWNKGVLHQHRWRCSKCGFAIEFYHREWAYAEIRHHKKYGKCGENLKEPI